MGKKAACLGFCLILTVSVWTLGLLRDRQYLDQELIRLHVVANSDSGSRRRGQPGGGYIVQRNL